MTVLQRVGRELNTTWDLERIFDLVTREAVQATGADYASIIQLEPAGRGFIARSIYGLDQQLAAQLRGTIIPLTTGLVGQVLRTGEPVCVNADRRAALRWFASAPRKYRRPRAAR